MVLTTDANDFFTNTALGKDAGAHHKTPIRAGQLNAIEIVRVSSDGGDERRESTWKMHEREVLACQERPPRVTAASGYGIEVAYQGLPGWTTYRRCKQCNGRTARGST